MIGIVYKNAPQNIFYSWVEVFFEGKWFELEAFILDKSYLEKLQKINSNCTGVFFGYGDFVTDFKHPVIEFEKNNTYIQSEGINQDFGVYDSPDELLEEHHQEISFIFYIYEKDNLILQILYIYNIIRTYLKAMKKSISNDFV